MNWRIEFAEAAERDFRLIRDHLIESYIFFGEIPDEASARAGLRLMEIFDSTARIGTAPHRGQRHEDLPPGLRQLTLGKASFWYTLDEEASVIHILAVFYGAQEQQRRMLIRLLQ